MVIDLHDKLLLDEDMATLLDVPKGTTEIRQCLTLAISAARCLAPEGNRRSVAPERLTHKDIRPFALTVRSQMFRKAAEAINWLGKPPISLQ